MTTKRTPLTMHIGTEAINKAITSIATRGKKLDESIQLTGLSVMNHVELHGDVTLVNRLYDSMPKGSRRNALAAWLLEHGKLLVNPTKSSKNKASFIYHKEGVTRLAAAEAKVWTEFKPEKKLQDEFDVHSQLQALLKRAEKVRADGGTVTGITAEQMVTLKALAA